MGLFYALWFRDEKAYYSDREKPAITFAKGEMVERKAVDGTWGQFDRLNSEGDSGSYWMPLKTTNYGMAAGTQIEKAIPILVSGKELPGVLLAVDMIPVRTEVDEGAAPKIFFAGGEVIRVIDNMTGTRRKVYYTSVDGEKNQIGYINTTGPLSEQIKDGESYGRFVPIIGLPDEINPFLQDEPPILDDDPPVLDDDSPPPVIDPTTEDPQLRDIMLVAATLLRMIINYRG